MNSFLITFLVSLLSYFSLMLLILAFRKRLQKLLRPTDSSIGQQVIRFLNSALFRQSVLGFFICLVIGLLLGFNPLLKYGFGLAGAVFLPRILKRRAVDKFKREFDLELIESLGMVGSSLKAGLPLADALRIAADNGPKRVGGELLRVLRRYRLGLALDAALDELRQRVKTDHTMISFGALMIGHRLGGHIPQILERISDTIRERSRVEGRLAALTAQGRTQAVLLCSAPPLLFLLMGLWDQDKVALLTGTFGGQVILTLATILEICGIVATKKVMRLDV